jgi:hypothetical protein
MDESKIEKIVEIIRKNQKKKKKKEAEVLVDPKLDKISKILSKFKDCFEDIKNK